MEKEESKSEITITMLVMIFLVVFLLAGLSLLSIRDNREDIRDLRKEIDRVELDLHHTQQQVTSHLELYNHDKERNIYRSLPDYEPKK
jgi:hypothetical protein